MDTKPNKPADAVAVIPKRASLNPISLNARRTAMPPLRKWGVPNAWLEGAKRRQALGPGIGCSVIKL